MRLFWCILLSIILLTSCNNSTKRVNPEDYIYGKAEIVLSITNLENFKSNSKNNHFISQLALTETYNSTAKNLDYLNSLSTKNPIYISLFKDNNDSLQFSFSTKFKDSLFKIDTLKTSQKEVVALKGVSAKKIKHNNHTIYISIKDSVLVGSSTTAQLEALFSKKNSIESTKKLLATQNKDALFSAIINTKNVKSSLFKTALSLNNLTNYLVFDADASQDKLILNGITKANDSTKSTINIFKNTIPQENELAKIAPSNSDGFLSLTFNDYSVFKSNLNAHKNVNATEEETTTLFDNLIEVGLIYDGTSKAVVLNSIDVIATKDALLSEQNIETTYRNVSIYNFSKPEIFKTHFSPFIAFEKANKYCIIDHFFVFANTTKALQNIIANYQNQTTFSTKEYYKSMSKQLSNNASILQVMTPKSLNHLVKNTIYNSAPLDFKNYKTTALQFIYDNDFAHFNAVVEKSKTRVSDNSVTEMLNIKLDNAILNTPQFVKNHRTKQKDIVVQDITNTLYLISNTGKIHWKKQLKGPVLGKIEQIDMYKNGRLQMAFATPKRMYVLDRNGKDVKPFPLKFNDEITQPLSVFDYDKKKNYRLLVTQGKKVLLYDGKGETVKGFKFSSTKAQINHQPQHIRIGTKDYIIIKTNNKLHILNRRGINRVTPKTKVLFSNQAVYNYKSNFVTTNNKGNLLTIDSKGNVTSKILNLGQMHNLVTTTKTMITQSENKLTIKDKTLELDFAEYSVPKLFYIKDKIYVSVTNLQSQKVLLFDSQAKSIANFPVYGNSTIELDNIDKDSDLEFVTKGESNSVLLYKIN